MDIGGFRSEWRNDIILFSQYGLRSEYYHPFTPQTHWFVAPRAEGYSDPLYFYDNNQLVSTYRKGFLGGGIDAGYQFGNTGELRFGYEGGWEDYQRQVGNPQELPAVPAAMGLPRFSIGWTAWTILSSLARARPRKSTSSGRTPVRYRVANIPCWRATHRISSG